MSEDRNVISFEKIAKQTPASEPIFSKGLYHWVMFVLSYYSRVKNTLKIDFESFVILQVVVSHHLYELNLELQLILQVLIHCRVGLELLALKPFF